MVPHAITSGNLLCGVLAIVFISDGDFVTATYLVLLAGLLDFFDGFAARLLKVSGEFGKQLDSLADVVTFGVVPSMLLFYMVQETNSGLLVNTPGILQYSPLLIAVFSALRLAKFNIDSRQSTGFIGLPTPANALWIISLPFLMKAYPEQITELLKMNGLVALFSGFSCFLLVSEIPLFSLKFKHFGWKENEWTYVFLVLSIGLLIPFRIMAFSIIIPLYILISIIQNFNKKHEILRSN